MSLSAYLGPRAAKPVDRPAPCTGRSPPPAMPQRARRNPEHSGSLYLPTSTVRWCHESRQPTRGLKLLPSAGDRRMTRGFLPSMAAMGVDETLLALLAEEIRLDGGITEVSTPRMVLCVCAFVSDDCWSGCCALAGIGSCRSCRATARRSAGCSGRESSRASSRSTAGSTSSCCSRSSCRRCGCWPSPPSGLWRNPQRVMRLLRCAHAARRASPRGTRCSNTCARPKPLAAPALLAGENRRERRGSKYQQRMSSPLRARRSAGIALSRHVARACHLRGS